MSRIINLATGQRNLAMEQQLSAVAVKLPHCFEEFPVNDLIKGSEVKLMIKPEWDEAIINRILAMDDDKFYNIKQIKLRQINHKRRLFKAYQTNGEEGVLKYLAFVVEQNKLIAEKYKKNDKTNP